ncbi:hypothetical protein MESS2_1620003 [Mesorhizobium metallidurans STM 2683]|uniref:Uncharacterized protein n=1 Tax=Mesorhizobium metallidurans STM 2683 TaxID=1297569 RepID=M5EN94_9HYPH|nr:hypothetical protein MESS2_1620003 [Mesorhizobium metallidurans STM 2683]
MPSTLKRNIATKAIVRPLSRKKALRGVSLVIRSYTSRSLSSGEQGLEIVRAGARFAYLPADAFRQWGVKSFPAYGQVTWLRGCS